MGLGEWLCAAGAVIPVSVFARLAAVSAWQWVRARRLRVRVVDDVGPTDAMLAAMPSDVRPANHITFSADVPAAAADRIQLANGSTVAVAGPGEVAGRIRGHVLRISHDGQLTFEGTTEGPTPVDISGTFSPARVFTAVHDWDQDRNCRACGRSMAEVAAHGPAACPGPLVSGPGAVSPPLRAAGLRGADAALATHDFGPSARCQACGLTRDYVVRFETVCVGPAAVSGGSASRDDGPDLYATLAEVRAGPVLVPDWLFDRAAGGVEVCVASFETAGRSEVRAGEFVVLPDGHVVPPPRPGSGQDVACHFCLTRPRGWRGPCHPRGLWPYGVPGRVVWRPVPAPVAEWWPTATAPMGRVLEVHPAIYDRLLAHLSNPTRPTLALPTSPHAYWGVVRGPEEEGWSLTALAPPAPPGRRLVYADLETGG